MADKKIDNTRGHSTKIRLLNKDRGKKKKLGK